MEEENKTQQTPDLGQFKSVQDLLDSYHALQAEYTRCTQKLKETAHPDEGALYESAKANEKVRGKIIEDYLSALGKSSLVSIEGTGIAASPKRPKTVREAGSMALQYLKGV
ncbi:MAG: hypothetical protein J5993_01480 [Clostridia bacterium]|nr:hypothetical protein [Clostridia bacterium]